MLINVVGPVSDAYPIFNQIPISLSASSVTSRKAVPGAKTDLILLALRGKKIGFDKASLGAPLAEISGIELFSPQGIHFN